MLDSRTRGSISGYTSATSYLQQRSGFANSPVEAASRSMNLARLQGI